MTTETVPRLDLPKPDAGPSAARLRRVSGPADVIFRVAASVCALIVAIIIFATAWQLVVGSIPAIRQFGPSFLWRTEWNPAAGQFGAAGPIFGTAITTAIAMVIAAPVALVIALLLVELAPPTVSRVIGTGIELLAAVPSVIYGIWGYMVFQPVMQEYVQPFLADTFKGWPVLGYLFSGPNTGLGMLTAGFILALMILPFITAVARDSLAMVPAVVKEAAHGMGSTTWEATRKVSLRYCMRGIIGAMFLGLGRALGETMAVAFVIGNVQQVSGRLFALSATISSTIANEFNEAPTPLYASSLVYLGLVLFVITLIFQVIAHLWLKRQARMVESGF